MKIGLVRHYKVKKGLPEKQLLTIADLIRWFEEYDASDIEYGETSLGDVEWKRCFASDLPRAKKTAEHIYDGTIMTTEDLRELPLPIVFQSNTKLPFFIWVIFVRLFAVLNKKTRADIKAAQLRIAKAVDAVLTESDEDTLIVSHAGLMKYMRKELMRRGFKGPKFRTAANGQLYLFKKKSSEKNYKSQ
ncbi:histidine phosphatase family protein [Priestia megaterium]|nr:histidine phosphatase family protein [Priestia megaterium]